MGDYFHTIVFKLESESDVALAVESVRRWMIDLDIILAEVDDSALSVPGHRPGPNVYSAVIDEGVDFQWWLELRTNGMGIHIGRQVFIGWALLGEFCMACDICERPNNVSIEPPDMFEQVNNWVAKDEDTNIACPVCGTIKNIADWDYGDSLGFGNLGFVFWNWPKLKEDFVNKISWIVGQKGKIVSGKL